MREAVSVAPHWRSLIPPSAENCTLLLLARLIGWRWFRTLHTATVVSACGCVTAEPLEAHRLLESRASHVIARLLERLLSPGFALLAYHYTAVAHRCAAGVPPLPAGRPHTFATQSEQCLHGLCVCDTSCLRIESCMLSRQLVLLIWAALLA